VPANTFPHTKEFIDKIYNFCINNINTTSPYAHGDWVLSNILIDDDDIHIIDWDNVGIYSPTEILEKLHSDLKSAFGDKFDPPSI
jgi:RIO-like serine/threonine protein kinase